MGFDIVRLLSGGDRLRPQIMASGSPMAAERRQLRRG